MALVLTIGGTTKTLRAGSLSISQTVNGRSTASFDVVSTDGSYRPAIDAEVLITEDGTRIFGGLVQRPEERGIVSGYTAGIITKISCVDFNHYAERRLANGTQPEQTLEDYLTFLVGYLAQFGVTLHGSQVTGPTIPTLTWEYVKVSEVFNQLATLTANDGVPFQWRIDEFKVLRMYQPSTVAAPFNITTNTPTQVIGDISVLSSREHYANSIIVMAPSVTETNRTEEFTGDGSTTEFTLGYTLLNSRGYVTSDGVYETLGLTGEGATWTYDPNDNTITRTSAPANTAPISIVFDGTLRAVAQAFDTGEITAVGYHEKLIRIDAVPDQATAQSIADAELAAALALHQTVKYRTRETGLVVGQSQTITVPRRNVDATGVITDINIRELVNNDLTDLVRDVTVLVDDTQTNVRKNWRDTYKKWSADTAGSAATVVPSTTTPPPPIGGGAPGAPDTAVQFNRTGTFGGDAAFTYDEDGNNLVMGGGGSSITATLAESCTVLGYDCHITDP